MQLKAVVHSFSKQLEYSVTLSDEPSWVAFYQGIFPNMISAQRIDQDGPLQRQGVDRIITLDSGKQILIDEKKRTKDYGDLLLEALSVCTFDWETKQVDFEKMTKPGWAVDPAKTCDYIAYAIPSSGKCFLLPYSLLRETCNTFFKEWDTNPRTCFCGQWVKPCSVSLGQCWSCRLHRTTASSRC